MAQRAGLADSAELVLQAKVDQAEEVAQAPMQTVQAAACPRQRTEGQVDHQLQTWAMVLEVERAEQPVSARAELAELAPLVVRVSGSRSNEILRLLRQ